MAKAVRLIQIHLLSFLFLASANINAAPPANATNGKLSKIIQEAYEQTTDEYFLNLINLSKKSKTSKEFLAKILVLSPEDKAFVDKTLGQSPTPRIFSIKGGIEFQLENSKATITRSAQYGELLLDGKKMPDFSGKTLKEIIENENQKSAQYKRHSIFEQLVPKAEAQLVRMGWALLKEALAWSAKMAVAGTGAGAILGGTLVCGIEVATKDEEEQWPAECLKGAKEGAIGGSALGIFFGPAVGFGVGLTDPGTTLTSAGISEAQIATQRARIAMLAKGVGATGAILIAVQAGKALLEAEGGIVDCGEDGNYAVHLVHLGGKKDPPVIQFKSGKYSIFGIDIEPTEAAIKNSLINDQKLSEDQATRIARQLINEHTENFRQCKANPSKPIKVMFPAAKKVESHIQKSR